MPLGTKNNLHKYHLNSFYTTFITSLLPIFENEKNSKVTTAKNDKSYTILLSYG